MLRTETIISEADKEILERLDYSDEHIDKLASALAAKEKIEWIKKNHTRATGIPYELTHDEIVRFVLVDNNQEHIETLLELFELLRSKGFNKELLIQITNKPRYLNFLDLLSMNASHLFKKGFNLELIVELLTKHHRDQYIKYLIKSNYCINDREVRINSPLNMTTVALIVFFKKHNIKVFMAGADKPVSLKEERKRAYQMFYSALYHAVKNRKKIFSIDNLPNILEWLRLKDYHKQIGICKKKIKGNTTFFTIESFKKAEEWLNKYVDEYGSDNQTAETQVTQSENGTIEKKTSRLQKRKYDEPLITTESQTKRKKEAHSSQRTTVISNNENIILDFIEYSETLRASLDINSAYIYFVIKLAEAIKSEETNEYTFILPFNETLSFYHTSRRRSDERGFIVSREKNCYTVRIIDPDKVTQFLNKKGSKYDKPKQILNAYAKYQAKVQGFTEAQSVTSGENLNIGGDTQPSVHTDANSCTAMPTTQGHHLLDFDDFLAAFPENEDKTGKSFSQPSKLCSNQSYCSQEESYVNIFNESMPTSAITDEFFMQIADDNHLDFEDSQITLGSATCPIQPPIPLFAPPQTLGANNVFLNHNDTDLKYKLDVGFPQSQQNVGVGQLDNDFLQLPDISPDTQEKVSNTNCLPPIYYPSDSSNKSKRSNDFEPFYYPSSLNLLENRDREPSTNPKASNIFSGAEALGQIGMFGRPKLITDKANSQINPDGAFLSGKKKSSLWS